MTSVLTVEAKLNGDATGIVSATSKGVAGFARLRAAAEAASNMGSRMQAGLHKLGYAFGASVRGAAQLTAGLAGMAAKGISALVALGARAAAVGATVAGVFGGIAIKSGLDRLTAIQDSTVALGRMLGDTAKAAELTGRVLKVVQGTPFAFPQFAEATRQLVAFGVKADKIPGVLQAIADSAAASGEGAEAVNRITQAFARMTVTGKLSYDIIESLGSAGVNALGLLGNHFGKTTGEVQQMISDGLIPAEEAMDILVKGIEEGSSGINGDFKALAGAAQELGKTVSGSIDNVKAAFARMGASWLKPFEQDLPKVLNGGVIPLLDTLGKAGEKAMQKLSDTGVADKLLSWLERATDMVDPFVTALLEIGPAFSPLSIIFDALQEVMPSIQSALGDVGNTVLTKLIPAFAQIATALVPVLPMLVELAGIFADGLLAIMPGLIPMIEGLVGAFGFLVDIIAGLPEPLVGVATALTIMQANGVPVVDILWDIGRAAGDAIMDLIGFGDAAGVAGAGGTAAEEGLSGFLGKLGGGGLAILGFGITAFGLFAAAEGEAKREGDMLAASLDKVTGATTAQTVALAAKALMDDGAIDAAARLGITQDTLIQAYMGNADALQILAEKRALHEQKMLEEQGQMGELSQEMQTQDGLWATLTSSVNTGAEASERNRLTNEALARAMGVVKEATTAYDATVQAATDSIATNGATLDTNTVQGMNNKKALDTVAEGANTLTEAMALEGRTNTEVTATAESARSKFVDLATQMGMDREEAQKLAEQIIKIPDKNVSVSADTWHAAQAIADFQAALDGLQSKSISVRAYMHYVDQQANGGIKEFANGGITKAANGLARQPMLVKGGENGGGILWGEPETGWEAYISGKKSMKQRNERIWFDAGKRLGMFDGAEGGGGSSMINVNVHGFTGDLAALADMIMQRVRFAYGGESG